MNNPLTKVLEDEGLLQPERHAIDTERLRCSCGARMCSECGECETQCSCEEGAS